MVDQIASITPVHFFHLEGVYQDVVLVVFIYVLV